MIFKKKITIKLDRKRWLRVDDFSEVFKREIQRSYRFSEPLCLIVIKLDKELLIDSYRSHFKKMLDIVDNNTRTYDLKSLKDNVINILLVNTALVNAKRYVEKTSKQIYHILKENDFPAKENFIEKIDISAYPINKIAGSSKLQAKHVLIQDFETSTLINDTNLFQSRQKFDINWSLQSFNTAIALTYIDSKMFLWEDVQKALYSLSKRFIDIIGSLIAIILFSSVMLVIAIAIKIGSSGPVIFRQKRIGYKTKEFTFLKFRTMYANNDNKIHKDYVKKLIEGENDHINQGTGEAPVFKIKDDPRITPLGKFLRKTSLDELPQLFNVLTGTMSLVGPRPPLEYEVEVYKPWHLRRIMETKPGITGVWQVFGRSSTTFDEMVRMDVRYIDQQSLLLDIYILIKTIFVVFNNRGGY